MRHRGLDAARDTFAADGWVPHDIDANATERELYDSRNFEKDVTENVVPMIWEVPKGIGVELWNRTVADPVERVKKISSEGGDVGDYVGTIPLVGGLLLSPPTDPREGQSWLEHYAERYPMTGGTMQLGVDVFERYVEPAWGGIALGVGEFFWADGLAEHGERVLRDNRTYVDPLTGEERVGDLKLVRDYGQRAASTFVADISLPLMVTGVKVVPLRSLASRGVGALERSSLVGEAAVRAGRRVVKSKPVRRVLWGTVTLANVADPVILFANTLLGAKKLRARGDAKRLRYAEELASRQDPAPPRRSHTRLGLRRPDGRGGAERPPRASSPERSTPRSTSKSGRMAPRSAPTGSARTRAGRDSLAAKRRATAPRAGARGATPRRPSTSRQRSSAASDVTRKRSATSRQRGSAGPDVTRKRSIASRQRSSAASDVTRKRSAPTTRDTTTPTPGSRAGDEIAGRDTAQDTPAAGDTPAGRETSSTPEARADPEAATPGDEGSGTDRSPTTTEPAAAEASTPPATTHPEATVSRDPSRSGKPLLERVLTLLGMGFLLHEGTTALLAGAGAGARGFSLQRPKAPRAEAVVDGHGSDGSFQGENPNDNGRPPPQPEQSENAGPEPARGQSRTRGGTRTRGPPSTRPGLLFRTRARLQALGAILRDWDAVAFGIAQRELRTLTGWQLSARERRLREAFERHGDVKAVRYELLALAAERHYRATGELPSGRVARPARPGAGRRAAPTDAPRSHPQPHPARPRHLAARALAAGAGAHLRPRARAAHRHRRAARQRLRVAARPASRRPTPAGAAPRGLRPRLRADLPHQRP